MSSSVCFRLFDLLAATFCLIQKQSSGRKKKKFYLFSREESQYCYCYKLKYYFKRIRAGQFHGLNLCGCLLTRNYISCLFIPIMKKWRFSSVLSWFEKHVSWVLRTIWICKCNKHSDWHSEFPVFSFKWNVH